jgi:signal transduction histidine kinase
VTGDVDLVLHCSCATLWVQPRAFSQAIYEILDNAIRATRRHHPVVVDLRDTGEGDV